jgi:hypothetical protein
MSTEPNPDPTLVQAAKLVKIALTMAFAGVAFSVRSSSYANGATIVIDWVDGPTEKRVQKIAGAYQRVSRDYMTGEILSGGRYLSLNRSYTPSRLIWATNRLGATWAKGSYDHDYAVGHLLETTSFDLPHKGDIRISR